LVAFSFRGTRRSSLEGVIFFMNSFILFRDLDISRAEFPASPKIFFASFFSKRSMAFFYFLRESPSELIFNLTSNF
jgi:hypothetical protein